MGLGFRVEAMLTAFGLLRWPFIVAHVVFVQLF